MIFEAFDIHVNVVRELLVWLSFDTLRLDIQSLTMYEKEFISSRFGFVLHNDAGFWNFNSNFLIILQKLLQQTISSLSYFSIFILNNIVIYIYRILSFHILYILSSSQKDRRFYQYSETIFYSTNKY